MAEPGINLDPGESLSDIDTREFFLVHLDDHSLYRRGVKTCLLKKLPNLSVAEFSTNEPALTFIKGCYQENKLIDLIITDLAHPGENGLQFAQNVRLLEQSYGIRTPIMMNTMHSQHDFITKAIENGVLDVYFGKNTPSEPIIQFIKLNKKNRIYKFKFSDLYKHLSIFRFISKTIKR